MNKETTRNKAQEIIVTAIKDAEDYPTKTELWNAMRRTIQPQTFDRALDHLVETGQIMFNDSRIMYTGVDNPKLQAMVDSCVRIK